MTVKDGWVCFFRHPYSQASQLILMLISRCFPSCIPHLCRDLSLHKIRNKTTMVEEYMLFQLFHSWDQWLDFLPTLSFLLNTLCPRKSFFCFLTWPFVTTLLSHPLIIFFFGWGLVRYSSSFLFCYWDVLGHLYHLYFICSTRSLLKLLVVRYIMLM